MDGQSTLGMGHHASSRAPSDCWCNIALKRWIDVTKGTKKGPRAFLCSIAVVYALIKGSALEVGELETLLAQKVDGHLQTFQEIVHADRR